VRERERVRERKNVCVHLGMLERKYACVRVIEGERVCGHMCECVCVCVCERERERESV